MNALPAWNHHLVPPSQGGWSVVAAGPKDLADVTHLLGEMVGQNHAGATMADASAIVDWCVAVLASHLWLVLLLMSPQGVTAGVAVAEYIAYDVDVNSRVLRCKHFYVSEQRTGSLFAPSRLLLNGLLAAARRSPKLRDVFIVSTGARAHQRISPILQRCGFRRIGSQHIGYGRRPATPLLPDVKEIRSIEDLGLMDRAQLRDIAAAFQAESDRAYLGAFKVDIDRLLAIAMGGSDDTAVAFLVYIEGTIGGFIAGHAGSLPLSSLRYLRSTFFYVRPELRATSLSLKLFDAFGARAHAMGLDGALLGTSSAISTGRVCRLLALRGFPWCGDVLAARVRTDTST